MKPALIPSAKYTLTFQNFHCILPEDQLHVLWPSGVGNLFLISKKKKSVLTGPSIMCHKQFLKKEVS